MSLKDEFSLIATVGGLSVALIIMIIFSTPVLQRVALSSPQVAAVVSATLVELLNTDRSSDHLATLTVNPKLVAAAQAKANDMASKGYFAHVAPDGKDSWYWFRQEGYDYTYAGENLAVDFSDSGEVQRAWMQSPSHHQNIVNSNYTEIGIATAVGTYQGHPTVFAVQMFGAPAVPEFAGIPVQEEADNTLPAPAHVVRVAPPAVVAVVKPLAKVPAPRPTPQRVLAAEIKPSDTHTPLQTPAAIIEPIALAAASPRSTFPYLYYFLVGLLLAAFAVVTDLEVHARHLRRAFATGGLALALGVGFLVASQVYFPTPVVTSNSAMTTSVAAALQ